MFDCAGCKYGRGTFPYQPEPVRASWHCGYMDPSDWTAFALALPGGAMPELQAAMFQDESGEPLEQAEIDKLPCPGWLARQPAVQEGAHAKQAVTNGVLREYYPRLENAVLEAADYAMASIGRYEAEQMKKNQNG